MSWPVNKKIAASIATGIGAALLLLGSLYVFCPKPELKNYIPYSKAYFDDKGRLLRLTLAKDERYRLYETLDDISPTLIEATILYEDRHFYEHHGVDILALIRAFWSTYITRERRVGASTLVMQVARLRWHIPSNTVGGKIRQIVRAVQLSRHYSKREILQAYFNLAPYGGNIEGIAAASLIYFNKKPADLNLPESLTLAVIPQNPNNRNPSTPTGYQNLLTARSALFERWLQHHPEDGAKHTHMDMALRIRSPQVLPFEAPHFIDYLDDKISEWDSGYIDTTLNIDRQHSMERLVSGYVESNRAAGIRNASALLVNYKTMAVEAMVGSAGFFNDEIQGQVNGTTSKRSPGSALKPFVYALAMDQGLVHPLSLLKDAPKKYGGFTPENFDKRFLGPISVKDALIKSRNVPAVVLQSRLKGMSFYELLLQAGVKELKDESYYGLALALGGGEVTSVELAALYAMLANGGTYRPVSAFKASPADWNKKLLSPEASYLTLDILKNHRPPDALAIESPASRQNEIAWKTGTSWAFRDAWSVGISGPYVLVVWVGNFEGGGNEAFVGRRAAAPLFFRIFDAVFPAQNWRLENNFPLHAMNLKRLQVCANTGDLYEKHCPASVESWFIPGVSPIRLSSIYRQIPVNKKTGNRACYHEEGKTELKVYEFWPSDFIAIFNKAGISLKTPPKFDQACELDQTSSTGQIPVITSPQSTVDYVARFNSPQSNPIPLSAIVDPDVEKLHWFIDNAFIGSSGKNEVITWDARPGEYRVRVVDDTGRSAVKNFRVSNSVL